MGLHPTLYGTGVAVKVPEIYSFEAMPSQESDNAAQADESPDVYNYVLEDSSAVVEEIFEDPSVVVEDLPLAHLLLIDVSSVSLCRMLVLEYSHNTCYSKIAEISRI